MHKSRGFVENTAITWQINVTNISTEYRPKFTKPQFWGFKVIDVGTAGKLVSNACYDMQQVCVFAIFLTLDELIALTQRFRRGYPYLTTSFEWHEII